MLGNIVAFLHGVVRWLGRYWAYLLSGILLSASSVFVVQADTPDRIGEDCWRVMAHCQVNVDTLEDVQTGDFESAVALALTDYSHYATYKIEFQGELEGSTDTQEFINQVAQTLADDRGWLRAGYVFSRVQVAAQADFSLILIQAELLDAIPGCSSEWSCRVGTSVYINEDRWNNATAAWNGAGGDLRGYRHMVVNHEVGHWLGHGHYNCSASSSNLAPVMQQQSIDLQGCDFNPWPLQFEIDAV